MNLVLRNLICLTSDMTGNDIALDPIRKILNEQPMLPIPSEAPGSPFVAQFNRNKVTISCMDNQLQIVNDCNPDRLSPVKFEELLKNILDTTEDKHISAFGFNFEFNERSDQNVGQMVTLNKVLSRNAIVVGFGIYSQLDDAIMNLNVKQFENGLIFNINIHFETSTTTHLLGEIIQECYQKGLEDAESTAKELVKVG